MHSKGIDWKSLMKQQPQPTTVIKKKPANPSPATPLAPSGSTASGDVSAISQPALPILFLKRMMPEEAIIECGHKEPVHDMLKKLSDARSKAAVLLTAGTTSKEPGVRKHVDPGHAGLLQNPLPAPEHVHQDTWFSFPEDRLTSNGAASTSKNLPPSSSAQQGSWFSTMSDSNAVQQQRSAVVESMHTSLTEQSAGSSLLTTAHSPSMQWQSALTRLRHLQQQTEEAFMQGNQVAAWRSGTL